MLSTQTSAMQVLLLEDEPVEEPSGVSDWLVRSSLNLDVLRRCLRYAREQGNLKHTLQRLAEQDPLTGIANRQGFQTLLTARLAEGDGRGLALAKIRAKALEQGYNFA